jgi:small subunit ribosomal protein S20
LGKITGHEFCRALEKARGSDKAASLALKEAGIPGLRYLDGMSRKEGEGTHNYVIWDEGKITIKEANGVPIAPGETEIKFAISPTLKADVAAALDKTAPLPLGKVINFSGTPPVLRFVGMPPDARIISNVHHVRKIVGSHHLTAEQVAGLPEKYAAPVAVLKDADNFLVVTDEVAKNNEGVDKPVIVVLRPQHTDLPNTFIANAYSPDANRERALVKSFKNAKTLLYLDAQQAAKIEDATQFAINTSAQRSVVGRDEFEKWQARHPQFSLSGRRPKIKPFRIPRDPASMDFGFADDADNAAARAGAEADREAWEREFLEGDNLPPPAARIPLQTPPPNPTAPDPDLIPAYRSPPKSKRVLRWLRQRFSKGREFFIQRVLRLFQSSRLREKKLRALRPFPWPPRIPKNFVGFSPLTPARGSVFFAPFQFKPPPMANTKSAIKAARKTTRLTARNKAVKTRLKTLHKKLGKAVANGDPTAAREAAAAYASAMDKAAKSGVVHKNAAARAKSRTAKHVFAK